MLARNVTGGEEPARRLAAYAIEAEATLAGQDLDWGGGMEERMIASRPRFLPRHPRPRPPARAVEIQPEPDGRVDRSTAMAADDKLPPLPPHPRRQAARQGRARARRGDARRSALALAEAFNADRDPRPRRHVPRSRATRSAPPSPVRREGAGVSQTLRFVTLEPFEAEIEEEVDGFDYAPATEPVDE